MAEKNKANTKNNLYYKRMKYNNALPETLKSTGTNKLIKDCKKHIK